MAKKAVKKDMDKVRQSIIEIMTFTGEGFVYNDKYTFKQATVKDSISNPTYSIALLPFTLTTDYFIEKDSSIRETFDGFFKMEENKAKYKFEHEGVPLISYLIVGIKHFFQTEDVLIGRDETIIVDKSFTITRNNFEDIADIITMINCRERIKNIVPPPNLNDVQREIWVKTMMGRKRKAAKNSMSILDMINIIIHFGDNFDYRKVMDLTILQLFNTFKVLMKKDKYNRFYSLYSSGQFKIETMEEHWVSTVGAEYKESE